MLFKRPFWSTVHINGWTETPPSSNSNQSSAGVTAAMNTNNLFLFLMLLTIFSLFVRSRNWNPFTNHLKPPLQSGWDAKALLPNTAAIPVVFGNSFTAWWSMQPSKVTPPWSWVDPVQWPKRWSTTSITSFHVDIAPKTFDSKWRL